MPSASPDVSETVGGVAIRPLSVTQERKLMDYLEEHLLELSRAYKKRFASPPASPVRRNPPPSEVHVATSPALDVRSLPAYLDATHLLLALILQIPPVDPSAPLRTTFLLRLTGDVMASIGGYPPSPDVLPGLLAWLDDLDRGWVAVLRAQAWDPREGEGVDVAIPDGAFATPPSQTDRARLRSLLVGGTTTIEEWLADINTDKQGEDGTLALERMGLEQAFDDLFVRTLLQLGALSGVDVDPERMRETC